MRIEPAIDHERQAEGSRVQISCEADHFILQLIKAFNFARIGSGFHF